MEMRKSISTTTSPEVKAEKILPTISDCYTEYATDSSIKGRVGNMTQAFRVPKGKGTTEA